MMKKRYFCKNTLVMKFSNKAFIIDIKRITKRNPE